MTDGNPTGEVRPCSTGNRANATQTRAASPTPSFGPTSGLVTAPAALPPALGRRIVGLAEPASGESRLEGVGDLGDGAYHGLGRQAEALLHLAVGHAVQVVLTERVRREAFGGEPRAGRVAALQGLPQGDFLIGCGLELYRGHELHSSGIEAAPTGCKNGLRPAPFPPSAEAGGLHGVRF